MTQLVRSMRAAAHVAISLGNETEDCAIRSALHLLAGNEIGCCVLLTHHIAGLSPLSSNPTHSSYPLPDERDLYSRALSNDGYGERVRLFGCGQRLSAHRLHFLLARVADGTLRSALFRVLAIHDVNVQECHRLASWL